MGSCRLATTTLATTTDSPLDVVFPCAPTASTSVGSTCALNTTVSALFGGTLLADGARTIYAMGPTHVYDGGTDGDADTPSGDSLFAVQGIFIP